VRRDNINTNKSEKWPEWASDRTPMERNTTKALAWIAALLDDRKQKVSAHGEQSNWCSVLSGIPRDHEQPDFNVRR